MFAQKLYQVGWHSGQPNIVSVVVCRKSHNRRTGDEDDGGVHFEGDDKQRLLTEVPINDDDDLNNSTTAWLEGEPKIIPTNAQDFCKPVGKKIGPLI